MTALVSFDRVFEVLDLKPLIEEQPDARAARPSPGNGGRPPRRPAIEFDHVSFRYPAAAEVSLASLESIALPVARAAGRGAGVLHDVSFTRAARQADRAGRAVRARARPRSPTWCPGCTTRPTARVRIGGHDLRDVTLDVAARRGRRGHPGRAPVPRHDPGQPAVRPARRHRGGADRGAAGPRRSGT